MVKEVDHEAMLSSPNPAFRPADVEFGMDGALYVSDFCSPLLVLKTQFVTRIGITITGVFGESFTQVSRLPKNWPKIKGASAEELCGLLLHEQNIVRHHARIELRKIINSETDFGRMVKKH